MVVRTSLIAGIALAALVAAGCGGKLSVAVKPNQPPVATLIVTRLNTASADSAAFELKWSATVARGRIDHYLIAIDPHSLAATDPAWQATRETRRTFGFSAAHGRSGPAGAALAAPVRHVVGLRAIDDTGQESPVVWRTLALANIPPTVQILQPVPSALLYQIIPDAVHIVWTGNDPDGFITQQPVKYKYRLFKDTDDVFGVPANGTTWQFDLARSNPDSLRRYYAPSFAGFDSVPGTTKSVDYSNLVTDSRYLFVLVGFDEAGAYNGQDSTSGGWSRWTNMLQMLASLAGSQGPILTMFNEYFNYTYPNGGFHNDPSRYVDAQVPGGLPLTFHWSGRPPAGGTICWYRWVLDLADLSDETPRTNEQTDWYHWSQKNSATTSATIGPLQAPSGQWRNHLFYIEAADCNGNVSLGIVRFTVIPREFTDENSLLIVDDTRMQQDQLVVPPDPAHPDSIDRPQGPWPTAAELDTFLLAHGGVRYRMTPDGTLSPPGIFAGYHFDTVSTRFIPGNIFPLALLEQYRHVVWFVDWNSATGINSALGAGMLLRMSQAGATNILAAYVKQGGQLWLAGGSAGAATMFPWNRRQNDYPQQGVFNFSSTPVPGYPPELQLGRFMFDIVHWESGFFMTSGQTGPIRLPSAGGWPGAPDYGALPLQLGQKSIPNDPVPPFRTISGFLNDAHVHNFEYLSEPNSIIGDPGAVQVLDTLMVAQGVFSPPSPPNPYVPACMTYYHGADSGGLIFSGFDLWTFTRPDLITLADFVLQRAWGLERDNVPRTPSLAPRVTPHPRGT
jgi:hypothetical protein